MARWKTWQRGRDWDGWPDSVVALVERQHSRSRHCERDAEQYSRGQDDDIAAWVNKAQKQHGRTVGAASIHDGRPRCLLEEVLSGARLAEGRFASVKAEIGEHLEDTFDPRRKARAKRVAVRARLV
jgi:hypothetical protein